MRQFLKDRCTSGPRPRGALEELRSIGSHRPTTREDSARAFEDNATLLSSCIVSCNGVLPFLTELLG